jgi:RNA-binding protein 25
VQDITRSSSESGNLRPESERYVIPPHLHDLQEAELPEAQRGIVLSEIAQFRERAAVREREKNRDIRGSIPSTPARSASGGYGSQNGTPMREWGKAQGESRGAVGSGPQGYDKAPGFVKADGPGSSVNAQKTDEQLEEERKEQRRRDEEASFRDVSYIILFVTRV